MTFDPKEARALVERLTGYTPGPWEQSHRADSEGKYRTQVFPTTDPDNTIATLHWHSVPIGKGFRTDRAENSALISSAPDLHHALTAALDEIERLRGLLDFAVEMTGEPDCWYDHHGYCQAHNLQPKGECWVELALKGSDNDR